MMEPHFDVLEVPAPQPGTTVSEPATAEVAMAWFTAEHSGLLAAIRVAGPAGHGRHAWQLAWTLSTFFLRTGSWTDHALAQQAGRDAAAQLGDTSGEAHALHGLALGYARSGRFGDAYPLFLDSLRRFEKIGGLVSQARIHDSLAWLSEREQRPADALRHAQESFDLFSAAGNRPGQVMSLNDIGYCHALLGQYDEAIACCERALTAIREVGEPHWEASTWDSLGYITTSSAIMTRPSPATSGRSACGGTWPTGSTRPTRSTSSATSSAARATSERPGGPGRGPCASSTRSTIPTATRSGPSCSVLRAFRASRSLVRPEHPRYRNS